MDNKTTTTTNIEEEARFLQNQVRWVLPEIKSVIALGQMLEDPEERANYLEDSLNAVYKRMFKALEHSGSNNKPSSFNGLG